ncbi:GNAT family N-acetyltransferase [Intestinibacter bartlettii]|uniref:GNAT family N-acetyltransferase n=1 Tax=Intestinibacter bartlettii TaxID=261299 RepID=A0ABS6DX76_9FIRM|nr:GNAT family N-acetyltransferase [Intestinibacter bartlettii]
MCLEIKLGYDKKEDIKKLFSEYTDMLIKNEPSMSNYLQIQNYDDELIHLDKKYGTPYGRLYIAYMDGKAAGCIALRKISDINCELKRLFVKPEFRGHKLGEILIQKIIDDAKQIGYQYMFLDTLPFLKSAIYLYKKLGFYEIEPYLNSPIQTSIFMKLNLK